MVRSAGFTIEKYFKKADPVIQKKRSYVEETSQGPKWSSRDKSPKPNARQGGSSKDAYNPSLSQAPIRTKSRTASQTLSPSQLTLPNRTVSKSSTGIDGIEDDPNSQLQQSNLSPSTDYTTQTRQVKLPTTKRASSNAPASQDKDDESSTSAQKPCTSPTHTVAVPQSPFTSSQRISRNGEVMIRNSDDESDASLEDLDELMDHTRSLGTPSKMDSQPSPLDGRDAQDSRRPSRGRVRTRKAARPRSAERVPPRKYKFSLEALVKQRKLDEETDNGIARAKAVLESYEQRKSSAGDGPKPLDNSLVESLIKDRGDEDDMGRLKTAIERTEALHQGKSWSFFNDHTPEPASQDSNFPEIHDEMIQLLLGNEKSRQQAFLGGFCSEYAMKRGLPEEVLLWTMDAVCTEKSNDLRYSYVATLACAAKQLTPLLTAHYIDTLLEKLGATNSALELEEPIIPQIHLSKSIEAATPPGLLSFLTLTGSMAYDISAEAKIHLLNLSCRLALDSSLVKSSHAVIIFQEAFASLVESFSEVEFAQDIPPVTNSAYRTITDATLRLQLLQTIPSWSSRLIILRQQLALAFFFQDPSHLSERSDHTINIQLIIRHLQTPQVAINPATDFNNLAASIGLLNIALDSIQPPPLPCSKEDRSAFNKDVDLLAERANSIFKDIVDTGASHMKRTEAKEVLDGFRRRLDFVVRTEPRLKTRFKDAATDPLQGKLDDFWSAGKAVDVLSAMDGL